MRRLILISLVCAAPLAVETVVEAQSVVTIAPQQCVWHAGDNPAWAASNLDENSWQQFNTWKRQTSTPRFWIRCHADLSALPPLAHPALEISFYDAYQVYLNGAPIGSAGDIDRGSFDLNAIRIFPVASGQLPSGPSTIALRVGNRVLLTNSGPINGLFASGFQLRLGDASILDALRARAVLTRSAQYFGSAACFGIIGVLAMMLIVLYLYDRSRREFLLLSVTCFSLAAIRLNELATAAYLPYPIAACLFVVLVGNITLTATQYPFFFALANRRPGRFIWALIIINCCCYWPNAVDVFITSSSPAWLGTVSLMFIRPLSLSLHIVLTCSVFVAFWPYRQIPRRVRPLAFLSMLWMTADLLWFLAEMTAIPIPGIPNVFQTWGVPLLEVRAFTTAGVITALLALLFRDQRQLTEERALFAGEIHAARNVQQYLIPAHLPTTPGFTIESEYRPAREVGGDFFQVLPQADGSLLLVIGDVAGKGIEAGMLATLIVGSVRTAATFTSDPARILALLNDRLYGRGLVTCLALLINQNGSATLVNAGHLPPYLNGKEMAIEGALPLGAVSRMQFPAMHFILDAGDALMLMTDGVVEAQSSEGELFGFERIASLLRSGTGGSTLADAAQAFGQEDDITVLTLAFAPAEVVHA
jgi:hypothetical protein